MRNASGFCSTNASTVAILPTVPSNVGSEMVKLMAVMPDCRTAARTSAVGGVSISTSGAQRESMTMAFL